ncbi:MAG: hypothetical protein AAFQ66_10765 [Pseudomonadota bacterium]
MAVLHYRGAQLSAPGGLFYPDDRLEIEIPDSYFDTGAGDFQTGLPLTRVTVIRDDQAVDLPLGNGMASFAAKTMRRLEVVTKMPEPEVQPTKDVTPFSKLFSTIGAQKERKARAAASQLADTLQIPGAA